MIREQGLRLTFCYAAGGPASTFFEALGEGRLLGSECSACGRVSCPPPSFCSGCGAATNRLREVGPGGELRSWTEVPGVGVFGRVQLDGGATAPMVHRLIGGEWSRGDRVRARFAAEPAGGILDLEGFVREAP